MREKEVKGNLDLSRFITFCHVSRISGSFGINFLNLRLRNKERNLILSRNTSKTLKDRYRHVVGRPEDICCRLYFISCRSLVLGIRFRAQDDVFEEGKKCFENKNRNRESLETEFISERGFSSEQPLKVVSLL